MFLFLLKQVETLWQEATAPTASRHQREIALNIRNAAHE